MDKEIKKDNPEGRPDLDDVNIDRQSYREAHARNSYDEQLKKE